MFDASDWRKQKPKLGVKPRDAFYHFVNRKEAIELYSLQERGLHKAPLVLRTDIPCPDQDYANAVLRCRGLEANLKSQLLSMLRSGVLKAKGFTNNVDPSSDKNWIHQDRWHDLDLNFEESSATGAGLVVTQLLVFDPSNELSLIVGGYPDCNEETVERWWIDRFNKLEVEGVQSNRESDYEAADEYFGKTVTRKWILKLRGKHFSKKRSKGGRPKGKNGPSE